MIRLNKIAWIGLGTMGAPMAKNLSAKGHPVTAYNRTARQADVGKARVVHTLEEAVKDAEVVIVMVSDGAAVRNVLFQENGVARFANPGTLIVNMSTIGVEETKQLALETANHGLEWMDAPVSGSLGPAREGTLVVLAGGSEAAFDRMKPLFLTMAKSAHLIGPIGSGAGMKLLVNAMLGATVVAASECMSVAEKAGFGHDAFLKILSESAMWSPILAAKRESWNRDEYPTAFALKHMTKDLGLMSSYAVQLSASMPNISTALTTYLEAQAADLGEYDMAAVHRHVSRVVGNNSGASEA